MLHTQLNPTLPAASSRLAASSAFGRDWSQAWSRDRTLILAAFFLAAVSFCLGERIQVSGGFGWDGATYAAMAKDFYHETFELPIDAYRVQRVAPSAIVHYGLRILGLEFSDANIIRGFGALNIACITILAWCWCRVARILKIGAGGKWLGFCGLFLNYAVAKHAAYYPVLTDIPAMTIAGAMLCCYLESRRFVLLVLTAIGAFTWPTLLGQGALLALFPREPERDRQPDRAPRRLNIVFAGLAAYYLTVALAWILRRVPGAAFTGVTPIRSVVWLSVALAAAYLFFVLLRLLDWRRLFELRDLVRPSRWGNAILVVGCVIAIKVIQASWASKPTILYPQTYGLLVGIEAVAKPGVFLLSQVVYYGPLVIVAMFLWDRTSRVIHEYGIGLTLVILFGLANGLDAESRHVINIVPLLFPFVVKATESLHWSARQYAFLAALCFLCSKCWFTINAGPMVGNAFLWPDQRYMMSVGPYLGQEMYWLQGGVALASAAAIYWICLRRCPAPAVAIEDARVLPMAA